MKAPAPVATDLAAKINEAHSLALQHAGSAVRHAFAVGELLIQSKAAIPHGQWLPWLREHITFSERTAQAYIRLTKKLPHQMRNGAADLSLRRSLGYLATPRRLSFLEELEAFTARAEERRAKRPPPSQWSLDDVRSCAEAIREFDAIFHRHGVCTGDDMCSVCADEAARAELAQLEEVK